MAKTISSVFLFAELFAFADSEFGMWGRRKAP
jgi:hypothetical protein